MKPVRIDEFLHGKLCIKHFQCKRHVFPDRFLFRILEIRRKFHIDFILARFAVFRNIDLEPQRAPLVVNSLDSIVFQFRKDIGIKPGFPGNVIIIEICPGILGGNKIHAAH